MNREPGAVTEYATQCDFFGLSKFVVRQMPGLKLQIYVFVKTELALLDQRQCGHRCYRFADGCRLESRFSCDSFAAACFQDPIAFGPFELAVVDYRDTDTGNLIE